MPFFHDINFRFTTRLSDPAAPGGIKYTLVIYVIVGAGAKLVGWN